MTLEESPSEKKSGEENGVGEEYSAREEKELLLVDED